ncbi:hypothetical protein BOTBODRAFT_182440 [Botryobasidium botryosum FD-172 SS1]|uniref:Uncharacterized protein n=1 Tax=Botryobasidium botryosum (strain FD-172 SS1) TaxID=930990 RepID=A0A067M0Z7_BOTB1|nr:hypothetical protein BOTBODRAFT_182440 [Botryobasidium botryosum FD-172 SS1]
MVYPGDTEISDAFDAATTEAKGLLSAVGINAMKLWSQMESIQTPATSSSETPREDLGNTEGDDGLIKEVEDNQLSARALIREQNSSPLLSARADDEFDSLTVGLVAEEISGCVAMGELVRVVQVRKGPDRVRAGMEDPQGPDTRRKTSDFRSRREWRQSLRSRCWAKTDGGKDEILTLLHP